MTRRISVIIPLYNAASTVAGCVASVLAQDVDAELEILCVDNNSTDEGVDRIPIDSRVRVITETKQGAYAARNAGVKAATGDILLFTDPDCIAGSGWARAHVRSLDHPRCAVSLGRVEHGGQGRTLRLLSDYDHARQVNVFRRRAGRHFFGYTNNLGTTAAAWGSFGPFEVRQRGADTIFVQRVLAKLGPQAIRYSPSAGVRHLEVDSVPVYLKKMFLYGRSSRLFREWASPDPPDWSIRRRAIAMALNHAGGGVADWCRLGAALSAGVVAWHLGNRVGVGTLRQDARSRTAGDGGPGAS